MPDRWTQDRWPHDRWPHDRWPQDVPTLTDGVVTLRAWRPEDAEAVHAACQDPEIQRWTRIPVPYLPEHATWFVQELSAQEWESGHGAPFAVVADDGRLVGSCGLVRVDDLDLVGEVGYWIAPWGRGRQAARRSVRLVVEWAFAHTDLGRLELYVEPENLASRAVAERVGCTQEGVLRGRTLLRGIRRDVILYALLRP